MNVHVTIIKIAFFYNSCTTTFLNVRYLFSKLVCSPLYPKFGFRNGRLCSDRKTKFLRNEEIHCKCSTYIIDHKILVWLPKSIMTRKNSGINYWGPQKKALFGVRLDEGREGRDVLIFLKSFVVAYFKSLKNVDLNKNFGKEVNSYYL